jgi:ABC-type transport system substrate-binding protein
MPGGKAALEIVDEVPAEFTTTVTKIVPDNERIRAALETGTLTFARIVPKEPYLKVS